ncbi:SAC3/GANP/Nin1/mts3/eIF-3 p25 family-domain-containing protein [Lentinula edodes]|uniref:SAC3/GANP/Nin1/mts3/eIF-3 p25 family-domain-containing protein n=1 Tax=Lentinula lateritia TaxID=40482 RepID=A0A9W9A882_9AGAR|nr:SAC3/GANP/Nin1/mts3/eIF-3 p25 family-domain-containing protein [Lentinula edodes]
MASASWPPQLKDWVAKCLGQMTDSNRKEAQDELRQVIADAFAALERRATGKVRALSRFGIFTPHANFSLLPKPAPTLKRKINVTAPVSKKAKKSFLKQITAGTASLDLNDQAALNRRAERFQREHEIERQKSRNSSLKANASASPFGNSDEPEADPNVIDWDRFTIVGTSREIFKDYIRLTDAPKPETIRPYAVLQETLVQLKKRWREKCSYDWICNQFKSLRQDLTVYEIHARMALESNDVVEYNSCQATLKTLYELGIPGKVEEFTGYRILMLLHGRNRSELNLYVGQLTPRQKADPAVRHALDGAHFTNPTSSNSQKIVECKSAATFLGQVYEEKYRKVRIRGAV